jgi:bacterioferritin-associated ferredoxin
MAGAAALSNANDSLLTLILIMNTVRSNSTDLPATCMYVCLCKAVTDSQIRASVSGGACTFADIRRELGVATQCGKCGQLAKSIVETATKKASFVPAA